MYRGDKTDHRTVAIAVTVVTILAAVFVQAVLAQSYSVLYNFTDGADGAMPKAGVTLDARGDLHGTTSGGGFFGGRCGGPGLHGCGNVFELTNSNGNWTYASRYDFTGGTDGGEPLGQVTLDVNGNLYGTASMGGATGNGVVWEITP